jgi:glycine cleavage system regulatory protein
MHVPVVMTLIGRDRPGLVDLLATTVTQHDGNWLESRMAHLGGHFAGILRLQVPADQQEALTGALRQLASHGLTVVCHPALPSPTTRPATAHLELIGHDRPGIIQQISKILARHRVNVESLDTDLESAPMTGEVLFRAQAELQLPVDCDLPALRTGLERIAADLMVDLRFGTVPNQPLPQGCAAARP